MVSSTEVSDGGYEGDSLELITGAELEPERPEPGQGLHHPDQGPERHTLILGDQAEEPVEETEASTPSSITETTDETATPAVPHDDVYVGDGDEIDLIDGIDPEPVYEPALIDLDNE
ncbi:hypothetical protein [Kineosporia babensis]|uniref:DUF5709 domain-containing protein n=1 Tax=Kineosporia babensis TaxID=499548 RepID=A0A9X1NFP4_9ACTN|nr:hypothetical protein [Kineosporia babensis]MCD5312456.1 hypothetical protein [Kineosporia babensis]